MNLGSKEDFNHWLIQNKDEVVGRARYITYCPYANYLNALNKDKVISKGRGIVVGSKLEGTNGLLYFSIVDPEQHEIPSEFQEIVDTVDTLPKGELTGADVLRVI